ncbi:hypothetical protein [Actinoplanes sp. NPDC048796]|uniref:hypothetical protein n=1 Tax=unclassified Actinoplanes TaxID=2626549 RepID=UPI0033C40573
MSRRRPGALGPGEMAVAAVYVLILLAGLVPPVLVGIAVYQDLDGPLLTLGWARILWLLLAGVFLVKAGEAAAWTVAMGESTFAFILAYVYGCDLILGLGWLIFY